MDNKILWTVLVFSDEIINVLFVESDFASLIFKKLAKAFLNARKHCRNLSFEKMSESCVVEMCQKCLWLQKDVRGALHEDVWRKLCVVAYTHRECNEVSEFDMMK